LPPPQGGFFVLSFSLLAKHTQKDKIARTGNPVSAAFIFLLMNAAKVNG
jgi:hypothetical protein